ncbi:hypothetical protein B0H21DRAFT_824466 [Amylocystis lapponica]|nr:hypothetical protein B0H21DRAFT_826667 [Amylocystis lapponica]KAH9941474.1 hypothetical protein B0H21DRAFT_824466 [Amylocystis lapponica]
MDTADLPFDSDSLTATLPCPSLGMDHIIELGPGQNPVFLPAVIRDLYLAGNTVDSLCHDLHDLFHQRSPSLESAWVQFYSTHALLIDLAHHALLPALALMHNAEHFSDATNATTLASTYADILAKLALTKTLWSRLVDGNPHCSSCPATTPPHIPAAVATVPPYEKQHKLNVAEPASKIPEVKIKQELHETGIPQSTCKSIKATVTYSKNLKVSVKQSVKYEPRESPIPEPANLETSTKHGREVCESRVPGPSMHELHGRISALVTGPAITIPTTS